VNTRALAEQAPAPMKKAASLMFTASSLGY